MTSVYKLLLNNSVVRTFYAILLSAMLGGFLTGWVFSRLQTFSNGRGMTVYEAVYDFYMMDGWWGLKVVPFILLLFAYDYWRNCAKFVNILIHGVEEDEEE